MSTVKRDRCFRDNSERALPAQHVCQLLLEGLVFAIHEDFSDKCWVVQLKSQP
jgi:hypothetical protein